MAVDVETPDRPAPGKTGTAEPSAPKKKPGKKLTKRSAELSERPEITEKLGKIYDAVSKGFGDQVERSDRVMDYWDAYNCTLSRYQNYTGGLSSIFVPMIKNGVDAIVTRYVNQSFPQSSRHVEVVTGEEEEPYALMALLEHYIERGRLRTGAARALLKNGQVEGQYNAYVSWSKTKRWVVSRETEPMQLAGMPFPELGETETVAEEEISDSLPMLEVLHDPDVLITPATASSIEEALEVGGSVTVIRRWTKAKIEQMIEDEELREDIGDKILAQMSSGDGNTKDVAKRLAHDAGIHVSGKSSHYLLYETWAKLPVDDEERLCKMYFAAEGDAASCKLNPNWNDRCSLLSGPVEKTPGLFKGEAPVKYCLDMQYLANDMANEMAHSMYFTLAPVLAVDPAKVTKWKDLVTDVAAVWPVPGEAIKMLEWPNEAQKAMEIIQACKSSIFETLGVNPSMLPQQTGVPGRKRNQAEVALEQQVDLLQTSDAVTNFEGEILTPYVQMAAELDHQHRDAEILVRGFGELGLKMGMESIEPIQMGNRWVVRWSGVEAARNAANIQQQIGWCATVMKMDAKLYMGYRLNMAPLLEHSAGTVFGARLARLTFVSLKDEMSVDPQIENQLLAQGFPVHTHAADNDAKHLEAHQQAPPSPNRNAHIRMHMQAMAMKQQAMAMQGQQGQRPQAQQGGARQRIGAMPAGPKRPQQQNGAIHPDQMVRAGAPQQPRKT